MSDSGERSRLSSERLAAQPEIELGRRFFPRGIAALVPDERTRFLAVCAFVGLVCGLAAVGFRLALRGASILFFGPDENLLEAAKALPAWQRLLVPAAGAVAAAILARFIVSRGGGGVAGIMEAVSLTKGVVSLKASLAKALCSLFSIASGGSVGREGPIIQLASSVASRAGRSFGFTEERLRVLVACGAAAGFAAAYNTPMAATLFVVEVIAGTTSVELLGPVAVSAVVATAVTHMTLGEGPLYGIKPFALVSPWEIIPYVVLALFAALLSTIFLGALDTAELIFMRLFRSRVLRGIVGGLAVGALGIVVPHVFGNGYETTVRLLDGRYAVGFVAILLVTKVIATACTVGSGGAGGVFTPTLLVGAAAGALVGKLAHLVAPAHTAPPAAYALVGMAALLAATTHAPLLAAVFVFEVTRDYAIVLPLLLTGYVATAFAKGLRPHSIYEEEAHRRGVDLGRNLELRALAALRADALMRPVPVLPATLPLVAVLETFARSRATTLHVADEAGKFLGVIDLHAAREEVVGEGVTPPTAGQLARRVPAVAPGAAAAKVLDALFRSGREEVPVVDRDGRLAGVVTRRQLESAVDREVIRRGLRLHEPIGAPATLAAVDDLLAAPATSRLEQVRVPRPFEGKRIGDMRVRETFRVNIIAVTTIRPDGGEDLRLAEAATILHAGEDLVVIGAPADIERFRAAG